MSLSSAYTNYDILVVTTSNGPTTLVNTVVDTATDSSCQVNYTTENNTYQILAQFNFSGSNASVLFANYGSAYLPSVVKWHIYGFKFNKSSSEDIQDFTGSTESTDGTHGLVPAPTVNDVNKFLRGDGTWQNAGGGSGVAAITTELWSGKFSDVSANDTLTLSDAYTNYDKIILVIGGAEKCTTLTSFSNFLSTYDTMDALGSSFDDEVILSLSGSTATVDVWRYGSNIASSVIKILGRTYCNPNVYSTSEQRIGTWIDDKPLYQVTLTGQLPSGNNSVSIDITSYNVEKGVSIDGLIGDGNVDFPVNFYVANDNIYCVCLFGYADNDPTKKRIQLLHKLTFASIVKYNITIKYTKTTD